MGVNTILTHSGRGDQSVEVRSVNPVVMRASTILFKDYDTWQKYRKLRATDRVLSYGARGTTTNFELEKLICELEGGYRAQLFPTGLAALAMAWYGDSLSFRSRSADDGHHVPGVHPRRRAENDCCLRHCCGPLLRPRTRIRLLQYGLQNGWY